MIWWHSANRDVLPGRFQPYGYCWQGTWSPPVTYMSNPQSRMTICCVEEENIAMQLRLGISMAILFAVIDSKFQFFQVSTMPAILVHKRAFMKALGKVVAVNSWKVWEECTARRKRATGDLIQQTSHWQSWSLDNWIHTIWLTTEPSFKKNNIPNLQNWTFLTRCVKCKEPNIQNQIISIKPTKLNPTNQFYQTKSTEISQTSWGWAVPSSV